MKFIVLIFSVVCFYELAQAQCENFTGTYFKSSGSLVMIQQKGCESIIVTESGNLPEVGSAILDLNGLQKTIPIYKEGVMAFNVEISATLVNPNQIILKWKMSDATDLLKEGVRKFSLDPSKNLVIEYGKRSEVAVRIR
jgi:hypothetical protein